MTKRDFQLAHQALNDICHYSQKALFAVERKQCRACKYSDGGIESDERCNCSVDKHEPKDVAALDTCDRYQIKPYLCEECLSRIVLHERTLKKIARFAKKEGVTKTVLRGRAKVARSKLLNPSKRR